MPQLTMMEQTAVLEARPALAKALMQIGRADAFATATKDEMCGVIAAIWEACRASMQRQSILDDEIPF